MADLLAQLITSGIAGMLGGMAAALLLDKYELVKMANLTKRIQSLEGYYGASVSQGKNAEVGALENVALQAGISVLTDPNLTPEQKQEELLGLAEQAVKARPDLVKKLGGKLWREVNKI